MHSNGPIPAEVYEKFLGFPELQDGQKDVERFLVHCTTLLDNLKKVHFPEQKVLRVLSIGTGYGRADLPFIKAYIARCEKLIDSRSLSFQVDCVDPSHDFQKKLEHTLNNDIYYYKVFSENFQLFEGVGQTTFQASGKSASGESNIIINGFNKTLTEYLSELPNNDSDNNQPIFHCIIAILSLQYIKNLKTVFPELLDKLCKSGLIVIGETCAEGAWISKPPPSILKPDKTVSKRWYRLWSDWHKVLCCYGINRRLRLFMPHDFRILADALERCHFRSIIPNGKLEFMWKKTVAYEVFHEVIELIRNGDWKDCVSSLYLFDQDLGKNGDTGTKILNILDSEEEWLSGEWKKRKVDTTYENGLRFYAYMKRVKRHHETYENILQKVILESSDRTITEQGVNDYIRAQETEEVKKQSTLLMSLIQSLNQHIEIDNGCFVVGLSVFSRQASMSAMGGSLIPCSEISVRKNRDSKFFGKLSLPNSDKKTYSRIWIWLYTLYIAIAKRPSTIAEKIYHAFRLNSTFNCVINMNGEAENLEVSKKGVAIELKAQRFRSLREQVWEILKRNASNRIKDVAKWNQGSEVVRVLEHQWGKESSLIKTLRNGLDANSNSICTSKHTTKNLGHSYNLPNIFTSDQPFVFNAEDKEALCGIDTFNEIHREMHDLFKKWGFDDTEPGIYSILRGMHDKGFLLENPKELWTEIFAQFYIFGLMLHEEDVNYILHIPGMEFNKADIWGGFQLFMDKREYSFFADMNNVPPLSYTFNRFISPFDIIHLRELLIRQLEEVTEKKARIGGSHSIPYAVSIVMDRLLALEKSIEIFRETHDVETFETLPREIKKFKLPVELYEIAVQAALLSRGLNEEAFWKSIPHINWINEPILDSKKGISHELLRDLAEKIAFRLARLRLECEPEEIEMEPNPDPDDIVVNGPTIPKGEHGLNRKREIAVFVTALISILKEAIQHRQIYLHWRKTSEQSSQWNEELQVDTAVHVNTHVNDQVWIEISNPCKPNDNVSNLRGGNQENELAFLNKNIPGWKIDEPKKEKGRWIRRFVRNVRKEINE